MPSKRECGIKTDYLSGVGGWFLIHSASEFSHCEYEAVGGVGVGCGGGVAVGVGVGVAVGVGGGVAVGVAVGCGVAVGVGVGAEPPRKGCG